MLLVSRRTIMKFPSLQIMIVKQLLRTATTMCDQNTTLINSIEKETKKALTFKIVSKCNTTKARCSIMSLPHCDVELPMFMPVGTKGTMKGILPQQLEDLEAQIILGNTYHLGTSPGKELLQEFGGLHNFMGWKKALLTDSGGFQMVSLLKFAQITEEGVKFRSPYDDSECMLTPEESIHIQNCIGADIIMQLDDVVDVKETDYARFEVATDRTTRWLDRCIQANAKPEKQNLFPIIQGGLFPDLRKRSLEQLIARDMPGYAIGGLSGGEDKDKFWPIVDLCTDYLPKDKPRYCMGVGVSVDLVVCCALGVDMFDCVHPTRAGRCGYALTDEGQIFIKARKFEKDFRPIDENCNCFTCKNHTRAYLRSVFDETVCCHLLSIHNIAYLFRLMKNIRESIQLGAFPEFVRKFMAKYFKGEEYPQWVVDSLSKVNLKLTQRIGVTPSTKTPDAGSTLVEAGDDLEEGEHNSGGLPSGFDCHHFDLGYREGISDDYPEIEDEGRVRGYRSALGTVTASAGGISTPSWRLSRALGALKACHSRRKDILTDEDKNEFEFLYNNIKLILKEDSSPSDEIVDFCVASHLGDSNKAAVPGDRSPRSDIEGLIARIRTLCQKLNWKYSL